MGRLGQKLPRRKSLKPPGPQRLLKWRYGFLGVLGIGLLAGLGIFALGDRFFTSQLTRAKLSSALSPQIRAGKFPSEITLALNENQQIRGVVQYSLDARLQEEMEGLFHQYSPDYGAMVALDPETGRVLTMISFEARSSKSQRLIATAVTHGVKAPDGADAGIGAPPTHLALRSSFPSASVFKVITAAAALGKKTLTPDSIISFQGSNHTLYRRNILTQKENRWSRSISLKEAFAKSVNTVFGRIGVYQVGPNELRDTASRFGFNRPPITELPVEESRALIPDEPWGLSQSASGFTLDNRMSPIQGAMIAASVANGGKLMEPYFIDSVYEWDGKPLYHAQPSTLGMAVDPATAEELKELMRQTITKGTSSKSFRGFSRGKFADVDVGGKTGSLTGDNPPGKYDWFVGYASRGKRKIAVAVLTVHRDYWRVKSSALARKAFETWFE